LLVGRGLYLGPSARFLERLLAKLAGALAGSTLRGASLRRSIPSGASAAGDGVAADSPSATRRGGASAFAEAAVVATTRLTTTPATRCGGNRRARLELFVQRDRLAQM